MESAVEAQERVDSQAGAGAVERRPERYSNGIPSTRGRSVQTDACKVHNLLKVNHCLTLGSIDIL